MADQYEPKLSGRAAVARKPTEPDNSIPVNDPLAELARIVTGRSSQGGAPTSRARNGPPPEEAKPPVGKPDILGDLEAELLSDLQASFTNLNDVPPPRKPKPTPPPPPPAEAPTVASLPPIRSQQTPAPPPAQSSEPTTAAAGEPRVATTRPAPQPAQLPSAVEPEPPRQTPSARAAPSSPPAGERHARKNGAPPTPESDAPPPQPARIAPPPARKVVARGELTNLQLRPTTTATPDETPPRQPHSRWEKPPEAHRRAAASRFAPPAAAAPAAPRVELDEADEELFGRGQPFAEAAPGQPEPEAPEVEVPFDDFDLVPGYGDEDQLPRYPDESLDMLVKRRPRRWRSLALSAVALLLIGGVGYVMLRPGTPTLPPIIPAEDTPDRIPPPLSGNGDSDQSKLFYERLNPTGNGQSTDTTLVTPGTDRIDPVTPVDATSNNPINRIIIPGGPGIDQPVNDPQANVASVDESSDAIGPRRVRTVVVRPDGTIVSSTAADAGTAPAGPAVTAGVNPAQANPTTLTVAEPDMITAPAIPPPTDNETIAIAGAGAGDGPDGALAITTASPAAPTDPAPIDDAPQTPSDPTVVAASGAGTAANGNAGPSAGSASPAVPGSTPATAAPSPQTVASVPPAASAVTDQTTAAIASGGMLVQVSSQRSEEAARVTFRDLQTRYPSILGPYEVNIQRADLGERGVFFRARVGPFSASDAQRLCDDLKSAGGDCILSRS